MDSAYRCILFINRDAHTNRKENCGFGTSLIANLAFIHGRFVPEAEVAPWTHYVLTTGDQVVFYEGYAFSQCQLNANVMTGKRVIDVAVNHQRWRVIRRRGVYSSKPDRISRADGATNVGRYVRKRTSYGSVDMACRNGK